ncbi:ankyrin repeat-containing domain protein [Mycena albidolilacea]|uniref:Ankyrin repeat-containing domain protein n=1 Tax=Mycena albidolilacea TaxID=1033008 RepID=A0AAD7A9X0_9AGAR|nr:ankyrin repeat-containing domain protein [Mycena albidolilacea]
MAEILGIVSGSITLLDTAYKALECFIDAYNAPKEQLKLLAEMSTVRPMLVELERRVQANPSSPILAQMKEPLKTFKTSMAQLTEKLSEGQTLPLQKRLTWSWIKKEAGTYLNEFERIKSSISIWLSMYTGDVVQTGHQAQEQQFSRIRAQINDANSEHQKADRDHHNEHALQHRQLESILNQTNDAHREQQQDNAVAMHDQIMRWITPLNFFQRQELIFETQQTGTGEWLLADTQFQNWLSSSGEVLWCRGIPGAGKTVLASMVVHHLRAQKNNTGVAGIYLDHKNTEAQTIRDLFASLWQQLAVDKPIPAAVAKLHNHHRKRGTKPSLDEVLEILRSAIAECSKVYFVVDALDEYPELQRDIFLEHLSAAMEGAAVNLLLTSRPHITLHPYFPNTPPLEIRANEGDLYQFVDEYIRKSRNLSKHVGARPELREEIRTKIVSNSDGMFLVPKLHLDYLNEKKTVKALRDALQQSPKGLTNLYDQAMERIRSDENEDNRNVARLALIWVANAKRLLSVAEIQEALAVEHGARFLDPDSIWDIADVIAVCAGLIIEETPHVRLVHPTTQEYLDSIQTSQFPDAHAIIASTCFTYLSFDCFSSLRLVPLYRWQAKSLVVHNPLLAYAPYCLIHASGEPELVLYDEIEKFLAHAPQWRQFWSNFRNLHFPPWNYRHWPSLPSPLWIAAASNLPKVFLQLFADSEDPTTHGGPDMLFVAADCGHLDMVRLLVSDLDVPSCDRSKALWPAAYRGHEPVVKLLLEHGAQPDIIGDFGETALHAAASEGHISIIDTLSRHGADVNATTPRGVTALMEASDRGNVAVVRRLIEYDADINQLNLDPESEHANALQAAAQKGNLEVVRLLVENGADVNLQGGPYGTALHAAWDGGQDGNFRFLLANGADVNVVGSAGTILHVLCSTRQEHPLFPMLEELVSLLIKKGANVDIGGRHGTPLGCASFYGRDRLCRILIENGADVHRRWKDDDGIGCNAVWLAERRGHAACVRLLKDKIQSTREGKSQL